MIDRKGEDAMNNSRVLGNNISIELTKNNITKAELADYLGMSETDVKKLLEGRMFLSPTQLEEIANYIGVSTKELLIEKNEKEYDMLIHNFRNFKKAANKELVLDLIDMYADLAEML